MESPRTGKAVANQFVLSETVNELSGNAKETFLSYGVVVAIREAFKSGERDRKVTLDETYWNYSKTTSKYRSQFLGESTKETQSKIDSGEYVLTNLN